MGWGFRKSVRIGLARLNFSRYGVGTSFGVRGLRIGRNAHGKVYAAGGRGPFWFRKTLSGATPHPAAQHAVRQSPHATAPLPALPITTAALLVLANVAVWLPDARAVGAAAWSLALIYAAIRDWPGLRTLRGLAYAAEMSNQGRAWYVLGWLCLAPLFFAIYAARGLGDSLRSVRSLNEAARQARPHQIAQLEADLGVQPPTEGACGHCGRPAVVGAAFCAYCDQPLAPKAQVCPRCATLAPPDARFCPHCGIKK